MKRVVWICAAVVTLALMAGGMAFSADKPALTVADCAKCHDAPPADIAAAGAKHKTDVSCTDCHAGHRPASPKNIPACSECHEGGEHYSLKGCLTCHANPHRPLQIVLGSAVTAPCLTCHKDQAKQLKESPSKHSPLFCTRCHNVHRRIPACVDCHKPHGKEMTQADCGKCHKAHRPAAVAYAADVPNKDCGACHGKAQAKLAATTYKHKDVTCVTCHKEKHKSITACDSCHPNMHNPPVKKRFPKCGLCHFVAHDLYGFPEQTPAPKKTP